jgi:secondary thiamine-phosphate synthase enzyme
MEIVTERCAVPTRGDSEVVDITGRLEEILARHGLKEGLLTIFVAGSTASVTTTEFEPGLRKDIPDMLDRIAPRRKRYEHDETWHDGNGHSHIRAALMGPSLSVPFSGGALVLGTWQQVVLIDHDNRSRNREIVVQLMGA